MKKVSNHILEQISHVKANVQVMSKAVSELNALCDVLSCMRLSKASDYTQQMYKHFCKPETGTILIQYEKSIGGRIYFVHFQYITWLGASSKLSISTTKPY